jgi:hypothetical protein
MKAEDGMTEGDDSGRIGTIKSRYPGKFGREENIFARIIR